MRGAKPFYLKKIKIFEEWSLIEYFACITFKKKKKGLKAGAAKAFWAELEAVQLWCLLPF